jgi:hypothetical protein
MGEAGAGCKGGGGVPRRLLQRFYRPEGISRDVQCSG